MKGHAQARHNLRCKEGKVGSMVRAYKHFMIAASAGDNVYTKLDIIRRVAESRSRSTIYHQHDELNVLDINKLS
jgi:hypothetical protein